MRANVPNLDAMPDSDLQSFLDTPAADLRRAWQVSPKTLDRLRTYMRIALQARASRLAGEILDASIDEQDLEVLYKHLPRSARW